ncbi:DinB family protein [Acidicapsa dinghuensis]|uniref:DinB family protein n=1 Tax=Acidicapsa dinghuensis TaxID=2218256 RepID=A0ABW1ECX8_9BACT|nr:DinB family protein [Acidicapsa dinghuensis]
MKELSAKLLQTIDRAEPSLRAVSESESETPALAGGWSRKQLVCHLIDSASNNHQRFVRTALVGELAFPRYDQDGSVRIQSPNKAGWSLLVDLWAAYNRYLAHVIAHLPEESLNALCRIGDGEPVTLRFLAEDYLAHLKHHLQQIGLAK